MADILPLACELSGSESAYDVGHGSCPLLMYLCTVEYENRISESKMVHSVTLNSVNIKPYGLHKVHIVPILRVPADLDIELVEKKLENEISYILYLNILELILEAPVYDSKFCDMILKILSKYPSLTSSIKWTVTGSAADGNDIANWVEWTNLKLAMGDSARISMCLWLTDKISSQCFNLWAYEPIRYVYATTDINTEPFISFFSFLHQLKCLQHPFLVYKTEEELESIRKLQIIVKNAPPFLDEISLNIRNQLSHSSLSSRTLTNSNFILQSPLEPTVQNLSNDTYQVFENDKYKYKKYGNAILSALIKLKEDLLSNKIERLEVICVGPGRGPLIDEFFHAVEFLNLCNSRFNIVAVERNTAVMPFLEYKNLKDWNGKVTLYCDDIRNWRPGAQNHWSGSCPVNEKDNFSGFHLIFSELIGSFGCNELMPEVLDPLVIYQNEYHCIWIPQSLECYIAPVHSPWLSQLSKNQTSGIYVPMVPEYRLLVAKPALVWKFDYRNNLDQNYHRKYKSIITINTLGQYHGLCGYFKAVLYDGIEVDNIPKTPLNNMWISRQTQSNSWLPMYFSSGEENSKHLYPGDMLDLTVSRITSPTSMSYHFEAVSEVISFKKDFKFSLF